MESVYGGLLCTEETLQRQKGEPDWRPDGYYELLAQRYGGSASAFDIVWQDPRSACSRIIRGWRKRNRGEAGLTGDIVLFRGEPSRLSSGIYELLQTYGESAILVCASDARAIQAAWSEYDFIVPEVASSHYELERLMVKYASRHWIAEMYAHLVLATRPSRCHISPWYYPLRHTTLG